MIKKLFYINKADRAVAIILLFIMAVLAAGIMFTAGPADGDFVSSADTSSVGMPAAKTGSNRRAAEYYDAGAPSTRLFVFDPNTADSTTLLSLGLQPWQVRNIYKYRAKGGVYRRPSDFARLYGLTVGQYKRLEPYIRISSDYLPASSLISDGERTAAVRDTVKYPVKIKDGEYIVLNTADTAMLKKVPGIGSGYARAIVSYRARLGGFFSVDQLLEIDGFPESSLRYFKLGDAVTEKINLNKLTLNQLRRHPYISYFQAKAIVDYRRLHGNLKSLDDLRLNRDFPAEAIRRLKPYVVF
ncbi:MAG: helix-hairpin-helix domain-containing protein [Prevotella sp.]|nr:helix-hairpin-helix domain-containing protein [Prevotella sp.]